MPLSKVKPDMSYESQFGKKYSSVYGCDESGIGCLAGDVFSAVVMFDTDIDYANKLPGLDDSKKMTQKNREILYELIIDNAVDYAIGSASVAEIDEINILQANFLSMRRAIDSLTIKPDFIMVDGNKEIKGITVDQVAIVKGDSKSISIAAASVLAKVSRDRHILEIFKNVHSDFKWDKNKSYGSKDHILALKKHGKTIYHREKYVSKFV